MLLITLFFVLLKFASTENINIHINVNDVNATIQGQTCCSGQTSPSGWMFRGIRYAKPPLGDLRFAYAQRNDPEGLIDAMNYGKECSQNNLTNEDCLFINVFTPIGVNSSSKLPVLFYIHGGGWVDGSGGFSSAIYPNLINRGPLVMVSINYRLGPFGFFTSREDTIPGNFAISDMIEALKWAQRYVTFFGGDPERVTIVGHSSGGESISTLTLSPAARGLFKQAVFMSGSAFGGGVSLCDYRNSSIQLAIKAGCATAEQWNSGKDFASILKCMRTVNASLLQYDDLHFPYRHFMEWGTVIDKIYMPDTLVNLALKRTKMNIMCGDVTTEWLAWETNNIENGRMYSNSFTRQGVISQLKNMYELHCWNNYDTVLKGAQSYYIDSRQFPEDDHVHWMQTWINLMSDLDFTAAVLRDAKYLTYTGSSCNGYKCQQEDLTLREIIQKCFVNFVLSGNPTPLNGGLSFVWPTLDNNNRFLSFLPIPQVLSNFHPTTNFFTCQAPTIAGSKDPFC